LNNLKNFIINKLKIILTEEYEKIPNIFTGDLNLNMNSKEGSELISFMKNHFHFSLINNSRLIFYLNFSYKKSDDILVNIYYFSEIFPLFVSISEIGEKY
jgi:hypothetical protein